MGGKVITQRTIVPGEVEGFLAHGVPKKWETRLTKFFLVGRELLVYVGQRRPIKKKRVNPLSCPREKA